MFSVLWWWPWALVVVVMICWGAGACRRLLRLRAAIVQAFAVLAPVWQRRLAWVQTRSFSPESEAAQRLAAARSQCAVALTQAQKKPLATEHIQSLAVASNVLDAAWAAAAAQVLPDASFSSPVNADTQPEAQPDASSGVTWDGLLHQALPLQLAFNAQVERYNQAIGQFPASVLAFVVCFKRAAPLPLAEGAA